MDIAFYGSSLVSAYWNGAATYYRGILRAMADLGHSITFFEPDAYGRQRNRDLEAPDFARVVVYPATEAGARWALDEGRGADVAVKASGVGVNDALLEEGVLALKKPGALVVYWDVDAPATLDRLAADPADPLRGLVPQYDLVLAYGGGPPVVEGFARLGARACVPIYNGLDPATHHPVRPDPRYEADLSFLGNRLPDREARVEEFFLSAASRLPGRKFLLGGSGWDDKPAPANVRKLGHVPTAEHNVFNCSAMAVLNVNRESMARCGWSPATRVFEAAGAGACLITDAFVGVEEFFEPGREILVARSGEETAELAESLTPSRARAIGLAARRRALADHVYSSRAKLLDAILDGREAPDASGKRSCAPLGASLGWALDAPSGASGRVSSQTAAHVFFQSSSQGSGQAHGQVAGQTPGATFGSAPGHASGHAPVSTFGQTSGQTPAETRGQTLDPASGRAAAQASARTAARAPSSAPAQGRSA